jgi:pimeloyl-ACP methyl ester carboxylesterase
MSPAPDDFPISQQPAARIVGRELLALAASSLLYSFGFGQTVRRTPRHARQRTVVLVHGYLANRSSFYPLDLYLRARRLGPTLSFNYSSADGIEAAAVELRDFLRRHVRGGRIDLVCHSLGGVVARVYLQELGGARRVDRCITLGTPHHGTYNAYWLPSRIGHELRPDSSLMRRVEASRSRAARVRFSSIIAGSDNVVIPRVFSAAADDTLHVPALGHIGLLYSPTVFRAVADRLHR